MAASTSSSAVPADSVHKVVAATTTASKRVTASTRSQKSPTATKPSRTGKSAPKTAKNTAPVEPAVATAADGVAADGVAPDGAAAESVAEVAEADPDVATLEADATVDVLLEESADLAAAVEVEPDDEEAAEGAEDTADFAWEDEEESEALRQARKDAEMTASADSVRAYLKQIGKVALLNAEEEVDLAKRIEAGLYGAERLRQAEETGEKMSTQMRRDLRWIVRDGERARTTCSRRTFVWWSPLPSDTPGAAWPSST